MLVEVDLFPIIEEDELNNISEHEEQWWSTVVVLVDWKVVEVVVLSAIWSDSINEDDDNEAGFSLSEVCDSVKVDVVVGQVTIVLVWTSIIVVVKTCVESFDVVVYNDSVVFDVVSIIVIDVNGVSVETVDIWLSFVKLDLSVETVDCRIVEFSVPTDYPNIPPFFQKLIILKSFFFFAVVFNDNNFIIGIRGFFLNRYDTFAQIRHMILIGNENRNQRLPFNFIF